MRTKKGFVLRPLGNEYILVAEGLEMENFEAMISMNASAAFLWKSVDGKDFDADTLAGLLVEEYGISRQQAEKDVAPLLQSWKNAGVIN